VKNAKPTPTAPAAVPEKATVDGLEAKWVPIWENQQVYRFDDSAAKENIYSIDTPPPTASGSLHVGHVFSYTHTDVVARGGEARSVPQRQTEVFERSCQSTFGSARRQGELPVLHRQESAQALWSQ
jgi:isoleucyl-tRNA synthetase